MDGYSRNYSGKYEFLGLYSRFQILTYQTFGVWVLDHTIYITHQFVLWNIVEELLQVYVNYPLRSLVEVFQNIAVR